jgi:hypothetical protein
MAAAAALDCSVFAAGGGDGFEQPSSAIAISTTSASAVGVQTGLSIGSLDGLSWEQDHCEAGRLFNQLLHTTCCRVGCWFRRVIARYGMGMLA